MATEATPGVGTATWAGLAPVSDLSGVSLPVSEVQRAVVAAADAGANTLAAAVAGKRIRLLSLVLVASGGANTVQLESDPGGVTLMPAVDLADNGQFILPYNPAGWCETGTGELLNLDLLNALSVAGVLGYVTVG